MRVSSRADRRAEVASWPAVDLGGLEGTYSVEPALSRRARRAWWAAVAGVVLVSGAATAVLVAGRDGERLVLVDLSGAGGLLSGLLPVLRPLRTRMTSRALVVRTDALRERTAAWHDVLEVRARGRWSEHSSAVLRDGTSVDLPGLSVEQAQRLARVVERQHPEHARRGTVGAAAAAATRHHELAPRGVADPPSTPGADDLGLEGPFRSTRRRAAADPGPRAPDGTAHRSAPGRRAPRH